MDWTQDKTPGPAETATHTRVSGPTVHLCADSNVACKWISGQYYLGQRYRGRIGQIQKTLHSWWTEKIAKPMSKIDDFVKHIQRERNQEADHWANIGAQGQRKGEVDRCDNSETW